jgi:two-component system sensor histidine kinase EvgS
LLLAAVAEGGPDDRKLGKPASGAFLQSLSEEERFWLRDHPIIRLVQDPGWPPIEFTDESGEPSGMAGDYLKLIEQRLGVTFERVKNLSWQEAYARLKRWEIDMTTSVAVTPERAEFWAFTRPYMKIPIVIVASVDVAYIADMQELAGKKVAVVDGYAACDWLPRDFPAIKLVKVKTVQEGLETLLRGKVFAYVENMLVVGYYLTKLRMTTTIKIVGNTPYVNAQSMAVRKDWGPLAGILDKALESISETERNDIYRRWLPVRYEQGIDYTLLWKALAVFTVVFLGLLLWIRKLASEIRHRKKAEAAAIKSEQRFRAIAFNTPDHILMQDRDLRYDFVVNPQIGLTESDMVGKTDHDILEKKEAEDLTVIKRKVLETGEPFHLEASLQNLKGEPEIFDGSYIPRFDSTGKVDGIIGYFRNITKRKAAESEQHRLLARAERTRRAMLSALEDQKRVEDELKKSQTLLEELVKERTAELENKAAKLERRNRLFVGRELRMKELKEKIKGLEKGTASNET